VITRNIVRSPGLRLCTLDEALSTGEGKSGADSPGHLRTLQCSVRLSIAAAA